MQQGTLIGMRFNGIFLPRETSPFSEPTLCIVYFYEQKNNKATEGMKKQECFISDNLLVPKIAFHAYPVVLELGCWFC